MSTCVVAVHLYDAGTYATYDSRLEVRAVSREFQVVPSHEIARIEGAVARNNGTGASVALQLASIVEPVADGARLAEAIDDLCFHELSHIILEHPSAAIRYGLRNVADH